MTAAEPAKPPRIFAAYPATTERGLIQRWGPDDNNRLSYEFAESAKRLAATHVGDSIDDVILLPFTYLYRHAIELSLKESIQFAALLRRRNGETDPSLEATAVSQRLKKKHRHSIGALVNELNVHMVALDLQEMPTETGRVLQMLAQADATGESFRYTGKLPGSHYNIDFPSLSAALADAYSITSATNDVLEAYGSSQDEWLEIQREMRAEYEADYASDMGDW